MNKTIPFILLLVYATIISQPAKCQIINTYAGNGAESYTGDNCLADTTALSDPLGVAVDRSGNVYIADNYNQRIRKVSPAGIITTIAGSTAYGFSGDGGPATDALLAFPSNICIDQAGNLYVADEANERIRKIDTNGIISTVAGNGGIGGYSGDGGPATSAALNTPTGVAVDARGNIYISDQGNNRIRKVDAAGTITTIAGNGSAGFSGDGGMADTAEIDIPIGLAVDDTGNVYFADWYNDAVRKISITGIITTFATTFAPSAVTIDSSGTIYISGHGFNEILKIDAAGATAAIAGDMTQGFSGDGGPAVFAEISRPGGLAIDLAGNLYFADEENNRVRVVSSVAPTAVPQVSLSPSISIFPNPGTGAFTIDLSSTTTTASTITITDLMGRVVASQQAAAGTTQVQMDMHVPAATYIVKVQNSGGSVVKKIVVE